MEPKNNSVIEQYGVLKAKPPQDLPATEITKAFERAKREGRGVLIPYFMCGFPSAQQSAELILAAAESGADIIELGIPFSDPLADGATIEHAGHVALERGMTIDGCMDIARQVAAKSSVPLLFMGYYNPILSYGIERFCAAAKANGINGIIVPDLPPEEAEPLQEVAQQYGLALIFLIPPTTPDERIENVVAQTRKGPGGFIYCVSLSGVTGSRTELPSHLQSFIERVRRYAKEIPLAVGFGLTTPEHIAQVTALVEGAVVGSALVNLIDQHEMGEQVEAVRQYIASLARR
jgi:tryptophan synthase alpha chain